MTAEAAAQPHRQIDESRHHVVEHRDEHVRGREQALGEIVIIVEGAPDKDRSSSSSASALSVEDLIEAGLSLKQASALIAKRVSPIRNWPSESVRQRPAPEKPVITTKSCRRDKISGGSALLAARRIRQ